MRRFDITESYTLTEIQEKYHISESALANLIKRNRIPKIKKGWYTKFIVFRKGLFSFSRSWAA